MLDQLLALINNDSLSAAFTNLNLRYTVIALFIFIIFLLLRAIFTRCIFEAMLTVSRHTPGNLSENILLAFKKPLRALFLFLGIYLALRYLPLSSAADDIIYKCFRSILIILIAGGFYELSGVDSLLSEDFKEKLNMDSMLIPFFSKAARFVIWALAIVIIAQEWNYDVNGFIAGLGLGGLAFALAAKDALANIFGGIVIILEKPFVIGEQIATPSASGVVEGISFRSTRLRAVDQSVITVPNSTLATQAITNFSRMEKRRINFHLGLNYGTSQESIASCINRIKQMLRAHSGIQEAGISVNLEIFTSSSIDVLVNCFTHTTDGDEYMAIREDINFKIMQILKEENVGLAFPAQSIEK